MQDFKKFILRGNVIDLAVAVVVGAAFNAVVQSLVSNIITPLIGFIFGKPNFKKFILRGNFIDLAVAVVVGAAFNAVVQSLVSNIITPLIGFIFGKPNF